MNTFEVLDEKPCQVKKRKGIHFRDSLLQTRISNPDQRSDKVKKFPPYVR